MAKNRSLQVKRLEPLLSLQTADERVSRESCTSDFTCIGPLPEMEI